MFNQAVPAKSVIKAALLLNAAFPGFFGETAIAREETQVKESATVSDDRLYAKDGIKHYNAAVALNLRGLLPESITEYKLALDADPRIEEAYNNLGVIYAGQSKFDQAFQCYEKGLLLAPRNIQLLDGFATALYASGNIDASIAKWRQLIELDPTYKPAQEKLAKALKKKGQQ